MGESIPEIDTTIKMVVFLRFDQFFGSFSINGEVSSIKAFSSSNCNS